MKARTRERAKLSGLSRSNMPAQFGLYLIVGGLSFLFDFVVFLVMLPAGTTLAVIVGFCAGTAMNYALSRLLAFSGGRFRRRTEVMRLLIVALIGGALTLLIVTVLMWLGMGSVAAKIVATPLAIGWNYLGRRWFVFHSEIPEMSWTVLQQAATVVQGASPDRPEREDG